MHRVLLLTLVPLMLATGCSAERFAVKNRSCGENFTRWHGGLTYHLLQGDQREGTFAYNPDGDLVNWLYGDYDFDDGDFGWNVEYNDDHYRWESIVDGYGTAYRNGDLDIEYDATTEFTNDATIETSVRMVRTGCEVTERRRFSGEITEIEGEYIGGVYEYERTEASGQVIDGVERPDGTWTEDGDILLSNGTQSFVTNGDNHGYSKKDWEVDASDQSAIGFDEFFLSGDRHTSFTQQANGTTYVWDYTVDYNGNGEGTLSFDGQDCSLSYTSYQCTATCGNQQLGC